MRIPLTFTSLLCGSCTLPAEIPDVTTGVSQKVGQVQKLIFQRTKDSGTIQTVAAASAPLLATWTALKAASDDTKVVVSDYVNDPTNTPGEERTFGSGNAVRDGIPIVLGNDNSEFEFKYYDVAPYAVGELRTLLSNCETLSVFLVDECDVVWGWADDTGTPTTYRGIEIFSTYVSDVSLGGYEEPDMATIKFRAAPGWGDNLMPIVPTDFTITDL